MRIQPQLPVEGYTTYSIKQPLRTHYRPATCEEVACPNFLYGWRTILLDGDDQSAARAHYIRSESGRGFVESRTDGATVFAFASGQQCFGTHQALTEREPLYVKRHGDFRGNPSGQRQVLSAQDWRDDFGEHQQRLADRLAQG